MSDDPLADKIARGKRAQLLVEDPLLTEMLANVENGFMATWLATKPDDIEVRERCWFGVQTLIKTREMLKSAAVNGRIAQGDLDRMLRGQED